MTVSPSPTLRALLGTLVDYAGLFPPAALDMTRAVEHYARYRHAPEAWMLGRFVVPVARLDELGLAVRGAPARAGAPWALSAIAGDDPHADVDRIASFNEQHIGRMVVDAVECRTPTVTSIQRASVAFAGSAPVYAELPLSGDPTTLLRAVHQAGLRAKVRTGGVTGDAIPTAASLARFIASCASMRVPFKATAGLHHSLRAEYPLSYESDAPRATLFGFLGVFVASVFAHEGMAAPQLEAILEERDGAAFHFGASSIRWREHDVSLHATRQARAALAISFGSCSFGEPVNELRELSLL